MIRTIEGYLSRFLNRLNRFRATYGDKMSLDIDMKIDVSRYIFDVKKNITLYKSIIPIIMEEMADSNRL